MKKIVFVLCLLSVLAFGQCLGMLIKTRVGVKFGFNPGTYNADDNGDVFKGTGTHIGFGMGTDILNLLAIDMTPQIRSTRYGRDELLGRRIYSYTNLYFPIFVSLKVGIIPLVSPYIGIGIGLNVQFEGKERFEFNGSAVDTELEGSNTNGFLILGIGAEFKLVKFRVSPEFTANINANADDGATANRTEENTDYHLSVGFYYSP